MTGAVHVPGASLLDRALATAGQAAARSGVVIRPLTTLAEMTECCRLFDHVWGLQPGETSEIQPALLRALEHSGSYVVGAYAGPEMIASSMAFLAAPIGRGLHSHITGVQPGRAGSGVGAAIKWHQRAWALARGIDTVTWTYDPLIARNAFFNIARLGARPQQYLVDFYGLMTDQLNAGQPSDRALVVWDLTSDAVSACAAGRFSRNRRQDLELDGCRIALASGSDDEPVAGDDPAETSVREADLTLVVVPEDIEAMRRGEPDRAMRWRRALRSALAPLIEDPDWQVTDFLRSGCYVFSRGQTGAS